MSFNVPDYSGRRCPARKWARVVVVSAQVHFGPPARSCVHKFPVLMTTLCVLLIAFVFR